MSTYVNKVQRLVQALESEKKTSREWRMVATNRLDMLKSIMTALQDHADAVVQKLVSLGIEPQTPSGMAFVNQQLSTGEEMIVTIHMIMSTLFPGIKEALESTVQVLTSIDEGEQTATSSSPTTRPMFDLSVFDNDAFDIEEVRPLSSRPKDTRLDPGEDDNAYDTDESHSSTNSTNQVTSPETAVVQVKPKRQNVVPRVPIKSDSGVFGVFE